MLRLMDTKNKKIKTKTMKTTIMKTMRTIYILAAFIGLQYNTTFAASDHSNSPISANDKMVAGTGSMLNPATPLEATFDDFDETNLSDPDIFILTPVIPLIADFYDEAPAMEISLTSLAPVTPREADFEEITATKDTSPVLDLRPVTPAEASFEELEHA
jgi:hypothetical protein